MSSRDEKLVTREPIVCYYEGGGRRRPRAPWKTKAGRGGAKAAPRANPWPAFGKGRGKRPGLRDHVLLPVLRAASPVPLPLGYGVLWGWVGYVVHAGSGFRARGRDLVKLSDGCNAMQRMMANKEQCRLLEEVGPDSSPCAGPTSQGRCEHKLLGNFTIGFCFALARGGEL